MGYYARDGAYMPGPEDYEPRQPESIHSTYQHFVPIDDLPADEIERIEAQNRAESHRVKPTYQHYGSVENLSPEDTRILEAQVAKKMKDALPYKEKMNSWIQNGISENEQEVDEVLNHAMETKVILNQFFNDFNNKLISTLYGLMQEKLPPERSEPIFNNIKQELNKYVNVLYKLKDKGLSFNPEVLAYDGLMPLNKESVENIRPRVESRYGKMTLGIPADLTKLYPDAKYQQRDGYAGVVMNKVFDELQGKKVNWEGYIILKEGEKTPGQLYKERRAAERKKFEEERQKQLTQDNLERDKMNIETWEKSNEVDNVNELEVESAGKTL